MILDEIIEKRKIQLAAEKSRISLEEQMRLSGIAVDAVMDSVSVKTTFKR